ncbi:MAG: ABC transporter ATP-binding protein [Anaerolineae bacterium]
MNSPSVIQARNLNIEYRLGNRWINALRDVSLQIAPFEIHGLVGESGSGKSTLALAIMRYLAKNARISSGDILLDGDNLLSKSPSEMQRIWGGQISLVPQDPLAALNPSYTVGLQIAEISEVHQKMSRKQAWNKAVEMLEQVRIADPEAVARKYPHQLSGGMQQRVTIAMALSTRPRLLILDEPTTALDVTTEATILDLFRDLIRENQAAALYVSHNLGVIAQMCDRMTVLYGGEVMASGPIDQMFVRAVHPYTIGLLASIPHNAEGVNTRLPVMEGIAPALSDRPSGCVFAPRCPVALELCHRQKPPLEMNGEGRMVKCHRWQEIESGSLSVDLSVQAAAAGGLPPAETDYVLTTHDLDKTYGSASILDKLTMRPSAVVRAVDDVSIRVRARATLGLVGESGSGKTSLARCIVGLESADGGEIELLNLPISRQLTERPQQTLRELQMVFQNPADTLNPYQTVGQALERTIRLLNSEALTRQQVESRIAELLSAVRLPADYAMRYPGELSGGEKQRVAIARAFAANPALVIADEPTSALDVSVQAAILNLLKDLRAREGASYLFISHDLRAVSYLADWLVVMYLGQIVEEGTTEQVYGKPSHPYTEALISAIPEPDPTVKQGHIRLDGDIPSAANIPSGCRFHTRCPRKIGAICEQELPPWQAAGDGHHIRCHIPIAELTALQKTPQSVEG